MKIYLTALLVGIATLAILLFRINKPESFFFDEPLYVDPAKALVAGAPDTNPEIPPLGKLIIAAGVGLLGDNPYGWRAPEALFGALTVVGVFFWVKLLVHDYELALSAAALAVFNNFIYVLSRVAMMDVFLVGLLIWGLVAFTAAMEVEDVSLNQRRSILALAGVMFGLACACKWNGLTTLGVVLFMSAVLLWRATRSQNEVIARYGQRLREIGVVACGTSLLVVPILVYAITYWPLCHNLHRPFGARELIAMNVLIWRLHRADPGNVFIASKWYSWVFQIQPQRALSYLVGNWVIMWSGVVAVAFCIRRVWNSLPEAFVVLLYAGNLLQWAITPQKHLYYYYYFPAAMFVGIAIPIALHRLPSRIFGVRLSLLVVIAAACAFLFCYQRMAHLDAPLDCALGCWP
jgi:dolichyl-phosphate-mannose-protein mannosyltransferase